MGISGPRPFGAPMEPNQKLTTSEFDQHVGPAPTIDHVLPDPGTFQRLIGRLLYLTITRLDIAFAVQCLSQFMHAPKESHMVAALRIVLYIK